MPGIWFYDQRLLDRFRPCLRYDSQHDDVAGDVETALGRVGATLRRRDGSLLASADGTATPIAQRLRAAPEGRPSEHLCHPVAGREPAGRPDCCVYGRCVRDGGRVWLQYWFWLDHNPSPFGPGEHQGDWEMVQLGLGPDGRPAVATYAQHACGEARDRTRVEFRGRGEEAHPVVYVAPFSHASYFEAGCHPYLTGVDHPDGGGPQLLPRVVPFGSWVQWPGRWGESRSAGLFRGPRGPAFQGAKWDAPARWHAQARRRRHRVALGRLARWVGRRWRPQAPELEATVAPGGVHVVVRAAAGDRARRHLYVTVEDDRASLASAATRCTGLETHHVLPVPVHDHPLVVRASVFDAVGQRSVASAVVPSDGGPSDDRPGPLGSPERRLRSNAVLRLVACASLAAAATCRVAGGARRH